MDFYVVVEGAATEREVYRSWIPLVNQNVTYVSHPSYLDGDKFTIISGNGYPFYKRVIQKAIEDIVDMGREVRLVVCVDSEEMEMNEKFAEIQSIISEMNTPNLDYRIVVQHFCFEAWALGNRKLRGANTPDLIALKRLYDVAKLDPEGLPRNAEKQLNRSQHASYYLAKLLNNKNKSITYSKSAPDVVANPKYFEQVKNRFRDTQHIPSFELFLDAFQ